MGSIRQGVPEDFVDWVKNVARIDCFVETGTNRANSTLWASQFFSKVISIEGFEELYLYSKKRCSENKNIELIHGDSAKILGPLVSKIKSPAIFWLDAHWCGEQTFGKEAECPVLAELKAINQSQLDHWILIDDARFFLQPPTHEHQYLHWPSIAEICEALKSEKNPRYIFLFEDVLVACPLRYREDVVSWLRENMKKGTPKLSFSQKVYNKLKRLFG